MNLCPDVLAWTIVMAVGVIASGRSLYLSIVDRAALHRHLAEREEDETRRQLGPGMIRRMRRTADHAVFSETMRLLAIGLFLYVGGTAVANEARACTFNPLTWALILGGTFMVLSTLHALYTRQGNDFAEGPTDVSDATRDAERDTRRDAARDDALDAREGRPIDGN